MKKGLLLIASIALAGMASIATAGSWYSTGQTVYVYYFELDGFSAPTGSCNSGQTYLQNNGYYDSGRFRALVYKCQ